MRACVTDHGQLATATRRHSGQCTCAAVALALLTVAGAASADCIDGAAHRFGTNPDVLRAIAIVESRAKPHAVRNNVNGSTDRGLFQINSIHLAELSRAGFVPADLHDVCLSSNAAALLLVRKMLRFGNTWSAVGAYHSTSAAKRAHPTRYATSAHMKRSLCLGWISRYRSSISVACSIWLT